MANSSHVIMRNSIGFLAKLGGYLSQIVVGDEVGSKYVSFFGKYEGRVLSWIS
jgi:hypothetical protein